MTVAEWRGKVAGAKRMPPGQILLTKQELYRAVGEPTSIETMGTQIKLIWECSDGRAEITAGALAFDSRGMVGGTSATKSTSAAVKSGAQPAAQSAGTATMAELVEKLPNPNAVARMGMVLIKKQDLYSLLGDPTSVDYVGDKVNLYWGCADGRVRIAVDKLLFDLPSGALLSGKVERLPK